MNKMKFAKVFAGVAFAMLAGAVALGNVAARDDDARAAAHPIDITAEQLQAAYDANQVAADRKYGDAYLALRGEVVDIDGDTLGPSLTIDAGGFFRSVTANMGDGQAEAVAALHKGQAVTLRCHGTSITLGLVYAGDCAVVE